MIEAYKLGVFTIYSHKAIYCQYICQDFFYKSQDFLSKDVACITASFIYALIMSTVEVACLPRTVLYYILHVCVHWH